MKNIYLSNKYRFCFIVLDDVVINDILVSNKSSFGKKCQKYLNDYLYDDYKIKPLHIMLSKMKAYVKDRDGQTK